MTRQEIFDAGIRGVASQGFVRSTKLGSNTCMYRGTEGRKCHIGWAIPDGIYDPYWDKMDSDDSVELIAPFLLEKVTEEDMVFLCHFREAHDSDLGLGITNYFNSLSEIAGTWSLDQSVLDEVYLNWKATQAGGPDAS